MRVTLTKSFEFDSAQSLEIFPEGHKCRNLHGHSFRLEVSVSGEVSPENGLLYDLARISEAASPLVAQLDHAYLNKVPGLEIPTIERMCRWFWERLDGVLPGLSEIRVYESERAWCSYIGQ